MDGPQRIEPGPGQESVWDYPRPPRLEPVDGRVQVWLNGTLIADSTAALRVLETYHPPTVYLPRGDIHTRSLVPLQRTSYCEWKGMATYFDVDSGPTRVDLAAWAYFDPMTPFEALTGHVSFYPSRLECTVDGERVIAQPGDFYGGWVTSKVTGPFKGSTGMDGW